MSRIGKAPVAVSSDVQVQLNDGKIVVKGKLGELSRNLSDQVIVEFKDNNITVQPANDTAAARSMWGTTRNLIGNMVQGVKEGFNVRLAINGVGYKAAVKNHKFLTLSLGYSHDIILAIPKNIDIKCEKPTLIVVSGADKQLVGQIAGEIIKLRPVEPYKGKGIFIEGSYVRRKVGKKK